MTGEAGQRPRVVVPPRGLSVAVEDVTFENIDFVAGSAGGERAGGAMIAVSAARVQFVGCTFRGDPQSPAKRAAIAWRGPAPPRRGGADAGGEVVLRNCVVSGVSSALEVAGTARFSLSLVNSLFGDCAAVVRVRRGGQIDSGGEVLLEHVTARATGPVVWLDGESAAEGGLVSVAAVESTFALRDATPLLVVDCERPKASLAERIEWQGQGSLVTDEVPVAAWRTPDGQLELLADEQLAVAGLVRSRVQFAGTDPTDAVASRGAVASSATIGRPPGHRRRFAGRQV